MKKGLKDYLHLYLGCEVVYEGIINGKELKDEQDEHKEDVFYEPKVEVKRGEKIGVLKEIFTDITGKSRKSRIGRKGLQTHYGNGNFKLILRPLSDMTDEEYWEADKLQMPIKEFGEYQFSAEQYRYLLSKHFDLFGLIEAGLAIDATTLKQKS